MLLFQWVERAGRVLAPDKNYYDHQQQQRATEPDPLLSIMAPDPNFSPSSRAASHSRGSPSAAAAAAAAAVPASSSPLMIQCNNCQQLTPVKTANAVAATPMATGSSTTTTPHHTMAHGSTPHSTTTTPMDPIREASAATEFIKSPKFRKMDAYKKLFRNFMLTMAEFDVMKDGAKLRKLIQNHPELLTTARTTRLAGLGCAVPAEGYTALMVACQVGLLPAVRILLEDCGAPEVADQQLQQCNISGETALHIAAREGHDEIVSYLVQMMRERHLPFGTVDVLGRTPLGAGLSSPVAKQRRNYQAHILQELFSSCDVSIAGTPLPARERMLWSESLNATVAHAEMPGVRVDMEDAMITYHDNDKIIVAVCDGHDDGGLVSEFAADNLLELLKVKGNADSDADWQTILPLAFETVDKGLRAAKISGGSTCVAAIVTLHQIVVANAGDSRCILIQSAEQGEISDQLSKLTITDADGSSASDNTSSSTFVEPMSTDHKPNLAAEFERITKAGLEVIDDHGFSKIVYNDGVTNSSLGTSRGFGDFEFKDPELAFDQQAVTAMPEVVVHERKDADIFLVLACDGVFDVMTNEQVADFVVTNVQAGVEANDPLVLATTADALLLESLGLHSNDNMSVIIVALRDVHLNKAHDALKTRLDFD